MPTKEDPVFRPQLSGDLLAQVEAIGEAEHRLPGQVLRTLLKAAVPAAAALNVVAVARVLEAITAGTYEEGSTEKLVRQVSQQAPILIRRKAIELEHSFAALSERIRQTLSRQ